MRGGRNLQPAKNTTVAQPAFFSQSQLAGSVNQDPSLNNSADLEREMSPITVSKAYAFRRNNNMTYRANTQGP